LGDEDLHGRDTCAALVITCSDFRFKSVERAFAESAGLTDDYDLIARPGGIRSLVAPRDEAARESMQAEVALLWRLHAFTRVLMLNHMSCRAYDDLTSHGDERSLHASHLVTAAGAVRRLCPGVRPEGYVVELRDGRMVVIAVG
jgi:hypothetical protein